MLIPFWMYCNSSKRSFEPCRQSSWYHLRWSLGILLFEMLTGRSPFQVVVQTRKMSRSNLIASGEERGGYVQEDPERACVLPEAPCGVFLQFFIHRGSICVNALSEEAQHLITALLVKVKLSLICWVRTNKQAPQQISFTSIRSLWTALEQSLKAETTEARMIKKVSSPTISLRKLTGQRWRR